MKKRGVGYQLPPGAISYAGNGHGFPPARINFAAEIPDDFIAITTALKEARYGPGVGAGMRGWTEMHVDNIFQSLRKRFAERRMTWYVANPEDWDGEPTWQEYCDVYYTLDTSVLHEDHGKPINNPRPGPDPSPDPQPNPDPPTDPPTPAPDPDVKRLEEKVRALSAELEKTAAEREEFRKMALKYNVEVESYFQLVQQLPEETEFEKYSADLEDIEGWVNPKLIRPWRAYRVRKVRDFVKYLANITRSLEAL